MDLTAGRIGSHRGLFINNREWKYRVCFSIRGRSLFVSLPSFSTTFRVLLSICFFMFLSLSLSLSK